MEKPSLSAPIANPAPLRAEALPGPTPMPAVPGRRGLVAASVLAPVAASGAALLTHWLLPSNQTGLPTRLYPMLLQAILAASVVTAVVQWAWQPLRAWACHYGPLVAGATIILGAWDLVTLKMNWMILPYFPGPDTVLQSIVDERAELLKCTISSLTLLFTGYAGGVVLGLVSGTLMPWMKVMGPIPATALVPLVMVLFADPFVAGAALIALAVWFPVTTLTFSGIANVRASYFDVARTLGAGRVYLIFRVAIPAAMPSIFIGLFMGLLVAFLALIVAETVGVKNGLGYYLKWKQGWAEYDKVYGALVIMSLFFSGIMTLMFKVRDRVLKWQKGVIRW
jgi:NitT/TauT family transport system permease protein